MLEFIIWGREMWSVKATSHEMEYGCISWVDYFRVILSPSLFLCFFRLVCFVSLGMISLSHGIIKRLAGEGLLLFSVLGLHLISLWFITWACSSKNCFNTEKIFHLSHSPSHTESVGPSWQLTGSWADAHCFTRLSEWDEDPRLLVQSWLFLKCSNKKQSDKNKSHFHFSLGGLVFEGGEAHSC